MFDFSKICREIQVSLKSAENNEFIAWRPMYEGWNFNSGNYLFTTDTK